MAGIWPGDIRCVVALSIDLDGRASWVQRDPQFAQLPGLMSMGDYGPRVGARRLLNLLDEHGIRCTFFVPGSIAEANGELVKEIYARGHEIGNHGYVHEHPATLTAAQEIDILERSRAIVHRITGEAPVGYRAPGLNPSERTLRLLAERGYLYDSSLMDADTPYVREEGGHRIVEIPTHWEWDDFPFFAFAPAANIRAPIQGLEAVYHTWASGFEGTYRYGGCFALLIHPQIMGRPGRILMLERLLRHMRSFPGVAFMRGVDIAKLLLEQK
ncbi:MAG: polysaccharide deacetylase [Chloroflexi bacterium]|nr:polysaccharide deacetylase [Chloroflexota bacterium]